LLAYVTQTTCILLRTPYTAFAQTLYEDIHFLYIIVSCYSNTVIENVYVKA